MRGNLYKVKNNLIICVLEIHLCDNKKDFLYNLQNKIPLRGYANCIIIKGDQYCPVGGYDISIPLNELIEENRVSIWFNKILDH